MNSTAVPPPSTPPPAPCIDVGMGLPCLEQWPFAVIVAGFVTLVLAACCVIGWCCYKRRVCLFRSHSNEKAAADEGSRQRSGIKWGRNVQREPSRDEHGREAEQPANSGALPEGWREHSDEDGNLYYFHELSKLTSWTRPTAPSDATASPKLRTPAARSRAAPTSGGGGSVGVRYTAASPEEEADQITIRVDHLVGTWQHATPGPERAAALPPGWEEHHDEEGVPYYYQPRSRRTTWSRPAHA